VSVDESREFESGDVIEKLTEEAGNPYHEATPCFAAEPVATSILPHCPEGCLHQVGKSLWDKSGGGRITSEG
jgi:hypothetical protein